MWGNVTDVPKAVGDLRVAVTDKEKVHSSAYKKLSIWDKSGDQQKRWNRAYVDFGKTELDRLEGNQFMLIFMATRGYSYRSDIAIDEIVLANSNCQAANDAIKVRVFLFQRKTYV